MATNLDKIKEEFLKDIINTQNEIIKYYELPFITKFIKGNETLINMKIRIVELKSKIVFIDEITTKE